MQIDFSHPHWQHLQIRQTDILIYLSNYLNLTHCITLCSAPQDFSRIENEQWISINDGKNTNPEIATQSLQSSPKKIINTDITTLPLLPASAPNIILSLGTPLDKLSALTHECHLALKPEGFLILFYPNKSNFLWKIISSNIRKIHQTTNALPTSAIVATAHQWNFEIIENFSFSLLPPLLIEKIPFIQGKLDGWCYKSPLPIGQYGVLILQKKTIQPITSKKHKKSFYPPKLLLETRSSEYKCTKK
jgi:hypothetical protein